MGGDWGYGPGLPPTVIYAHIYDCVCMCLHKQSVFLSENSSRGGRIVAQRGKGGRHE